MFSAVLASEQTLRVAKRDFRNVGKFELTSERAGYVITGPTGSGKSTFAMLPVLKKARKGVLMVEPTNANVGNIITEFSVLMPSIVRREYRTYDKYPIPRACDLTTGPRSRFDVVTVREFRSSLASPNFLKDYDVVVLDEYHLISQDVFDSLAFLRSNRALIRKYILISATPGKLTSEPTFGDDVVDSPSKFPLSILDAPRSTFMKSVYNPRHFLQRGNKCVVVIMPNAVYIEKYRSILNDIDIMPFVIDVNTSQKRYREIQGLIGRGQPMVVILDPAVEAGISLRMSVFLNPGYTYMIKYDGAVVSETYRALTPQESAQRGGRAGRGIMTQYIYNTALENVDRSDPSEYLVANTYVLIKAHGLELPNIPDSLFERFSRLRSVTQRTAREILKDTALDPVVAAYKYDDKGRKFKECGGTADGFLELSAKDLKVYYFKGGYVIAPVFSLVNVSFDPYQLISEDNQASVLEHMVDLHKDALGSLSITKRAEILRENMDVYVNDFVAAVKSVLDYDRAEYYTMGTKPATLRDVFNDVGYDIASLFESADKVPGIILGYDEKVLSGDKIGYSHWLTVDSQKVWLTPKKDFIRDQRLKRRPFVTAIITALKNEINVAALSTVAGVSVNLEKYKGQAPLSHEWYTRHVLRKEKLAKPEKLAGVEPYSLANNTVSDLVEFDQTNWIVEQLGKLPAVAGYNPEYNLEHFEFVPLKKEDRGRIGKEHVEIAERLAYDNELSPDEGDAATTLYQIVKDGYRKFHDINYDDGTAF